jgi:hypothetical protein
VLAGSRVKPPDWSLVSARRIGKNKRIKIPGLRKRKTGDFFGIRVPAPQGRGSPTSVRNPVPKSRIPDSFSLEGEA